MDRLNALGVERGTYVDVGAYDPIHVSNTLLLHKRGWRGINVDLNPAAIARFEDLRPGDINVHAALSDVAETVTVQLFECALVNRIVPAGASAAKTSATTRTMQTLTLRELLTRHPPPGDRVDYLNVDCEGHDLSVLRGMDWGRWRPHVITVEALDKEAREAIEVYLGARGYRLGATFQFTLCFVCG